MEDPPTKAGDKSAPNNEGNMPLEPKVRIPVVIESNGLLDPTPRGPFVALAQRNQQESPLLCLAPEIRNMIYGYIFSDVEIDLRGRYLDLWTVSVNNLKTRFSGKPTAHQHVGFLRVCRAIYAEARLLPFVHARFKFYYDCPRGAIVQHMQQRYKLRITTRLQQPDRVTKILPVQIDAIATVEVASDIRPTLRTFLEDVRCLPALKRILWFPMGETLGLTRSNSEKLNQKQVDRIQKAVGKSIRVVAREVVIKADLSDDKA